MQLILIGKTLPDGKVTYIKLEEDVSLGYLGRTLLRFYTKETRLDALLDLGNLQSLRPSPFGYYTGYEDEIHCLSKIRDLNFPAQQEGAAMAESKDSFASAKYPAFLWEDGQWLVVRDKEFVPFDLNTDFQVRQPRSLKSLSIQRISSHRKRCDGNGEIKGFGFGSWAEMAAKAMENDDTYFIFAKNKLIATINPKPSC